MDRAEAIAFFERKKAAIANGGHILLGYGAYDAFCSAVDALREKEALARNLHDVAQACKWISVSERLPEDGNARVLVHLVHSVPQGGKPKIDTDRYLNGMWVRWNGRVTHWMPLPEPPKD